MEHDTHMTVLSSAAALVSSAQTLLQLRNTLSSARFITHEMLLCKLLNFKYNRERLQQIYRYLSNKEELWTLEISKGNDFAVKFCNNHSNCLHCIAQEAVRQVKDRAINNTKWAWPGNQRSVVRVHAQGPVSTIMQTIIYIAQEERPMQHQRTHCSSLPVSRQKTRAVDRP